MKKVAKEINYCFIFFKNSRSFLLLLFLCLQIKVFPTTDSLSILCYGNLSGILEYCGCPNLESGGLVTLGGIWEDYKSKNNNILSLGCGNIFHKNDTLQNMYVDSILRIFDPGILNIGETELLSFDNNKHKNNFISLNSNTENVCKYLIKTIAGIRIGIVGLVDNIYFDRCKTSFFVKRDKEYIKNIVNIAKIKSDILIVMSCMNDTRYEKSLFLSIPNIDVMISLDNTNVKNLMIDDRQYLALGSRGRNLAAISIKKDVNNFSISSKFINMTYRSPLKSSKVIKVLNQYYSKLPLKDQQKIEKIRNTSLDF